MVQKGRKICKHPGRQVKEQLFYCILEKIRAAEKKGMKKCPKDPKGAVGDMKQGLGKDHDDPQINRAGGDGFLFFLSLVSDRERWASYVQTD